MRRQWPFSWNIRAFQLSARREHQNQQQQDQIKKLESKCEEFLKRLEDLEEKLASYDEHKKGKAMFITYVGM